jgi:hypothetical protein
MKIVLYMFGYDLCLSATTSTYYLAVVCEFREIIVTFSIEKNLPNHYE